MSSGSDGVTSRAREIVIHRLNTGWIASPRAVGIFAEGRDPSRPGGFVPVPSMVPAPAWYIAGAGPRILVDTGTGTAAAIQAAQGRYGLELEAPRIGPEHDIVTQLERLGVGAEQIDLVIQTHLHFDHVAGAERFPNARFLIHHLELPWALCPPRYAQTHYLPEFGRHVRAVLDQVELVTTDAYQVTPEIRMVHTGGHSPGHCAVFVETRLGRVVIAGDAVFNYANLEEGWPQGFLFDLSGALRSLELVRTADVILLNHDPRFDELFEGDRVGDAALADATVAYMRRLRTTSALDDSRVDQR
jgi:N-acyl homoserine lactone hydrolase